MEPTLASAPAPGPHEHEQLHDPKPDIGPCRRRDARSPGQSDDRRAWLRLSVGRSAARRAGRRLLPHQPGVRPDRSHRTVARRRSQAVLLSCRPAMWSRRCGVAGVDFAALANNHAADYEMAGLLDTVGVLDEAGIAHAGAGADLAAARAPAFLTAAEWRIGVVAFADHPAVWAAGPTSPGINYMPVSLASSHFAAIEDALAIARRAGGSGHLLHPLGPQSAGPADSRLPRLRPASDRDGSGCLLGPQRARRPGHRGLAGQTDPLLTGDFVDDYTVDPELRNDLSGLFLLRAWPPALAWIDVIPAAISHCQVNRARGAERGEFSERFTALCCRTGNRRAGRG